ncbi:MAG: penicillin acylase family protein [Ignavibacteria bacterium]|nr:penicillin acylase family protein [Ignavibacteria bacterium]
MKLPIKKNQTLLLILSFFLFFACFVFFSLEFAKVSLLESKFEGQTAQLKSEVSIYKDKYGIPHIISSNLEDTFFGVGFSHAIDRLWQMDFLRRVSQGRLSEIFGVEALKFDQFFRALQLKDIALSIVPNLDTTSYKILLAYCNGINFFLENFQNKLPLEFNALNYKPEPWTLEDCIMIGRLLAFTLNFSFWLDLTFGDIEQRIGHQQARSLIPDSTTIFPSFNQISPQQKYGKDFNFKELMLSASLKYFKEFYPFLYSIGGSNTWAIRVKTRNGYTSILACDPHLTITLPPIWYQIHISSPQFNLVGLTIPGIPLPLVGRNDFIAWGITNGMVDDCDFFSHQLDSTGKFVINHLGEKTRLRFKTDTIKIRGKPNFVYYQRYLGDDIIISDFLLLKDNEVSAKVFSITDSPKLNFALTFKWTGKFVSDEIKSLYLISQAKGWNDFVKAKNYWGAPASNFSFADKNGNIGLMLAGFYPERVNVDPNLPNNSSLKFSYWVGQRRFDEKFNIFNPPEGFVYNANNKSYQSNLFISNYWPDPTRAERIYDILQNTQPSDILDIQVMQNDLKSLQAQKILSEVLPILELRKKDLNDIELQAFEKLKIWNFILSPNYVAPSIYQTFVLKFLENLLLDELGEELFKQYLYLDFIATRTLLKVMSDSNSVFFFDKIQNDTLTKEELIFKSFRSTINELKNKTKTENVEKWTYGNLHKVRLEHILAKNKFLEPTFSLGEYPYGGNNSTINYAGGKLFDQNLVEIASSARFIADLGDTLVKTILSGGNSGQNLSRNFSDQFRLWLNGGYISIPISKIPSKHSQIFAIIKPK